MRTPIDRGLTAPPAYTPFGGYARLDRLVKSLDSADRRTCRGPACLWVACRSAAVSVLWLDGYRLPHRLGALRPRRGCGPGRTADSRGQRARTERQSRSCRSSSPLSCSGRSGGFAVGALSTLSIYLNRHSEWSVYTPIRGLSAATAGIAAWTIVPSPTSFAGYLLASLVASVAFLAVGRRLRRLTALGATR